MCDHNEQKTPSNPGGIYQAMTCILASLGPIGKGQKNKEQGFMYRGIDDVYNALNPLMAENNVFMIPTVRERTSVDRPTKSGGIMECVTLLVDYQFCHADGSRVTCTVMGEGRDSADKATNKAMAAAHKYALMQTFCIPTADLANDDADKYTPEELAQKKQPQKQAPHKLSSPTSPPRLNLEGIEYDLSCITTEKDFLAYWNAHRIGEDHPDAARLLALFGKRKKEIMAQAASADSTSQASPPPQAIPHISLDDARFEFMASNTPEDLKATAVRLRIMQDNPDYQAITEAYTQRLDELGGGKSKPANAQGAKITDEQRKAIQASYSGWQRDERLTDISQRLGREVSSVNDLSRGEASDLLSSFKESAA